eukprot:jgi/Astpho2/8435/Aster-x1519
MDITTAGATVSLADKPLQNEKQIIIVRHGLTTWNEQHRIQGSSNGAELTPFGELQAVRCRDALSHMGIDSCFSSPIRRAASTADIMWRDRPGKVTFLDSLKEAHLEDAARDYREEFTTWRQRPAEFTFDGRWPLKEVFDQAKEAWQEILTAPGSSHLVITHKSMMRAFLCVALGLPPSSFRAVDIHNGGVSTFRVNKRGEPMLTSMNQTAHMHQDGIYY